MATLETGGFTQPRVQLQPALVDPRILALDLSSIGRGAGQGLQLAGAYGQMRDAAVARQQEEEFRPLVNAARRLQLENAPRIATNQMALQNIALARERATPIVRSVVNSIEEVPRLDAAGNPTGKTDVFNVATETIEDAVTGEISTRKSRGKVATSAEQQALSDSLVASRAATAEANMKRIEQAIEFNRQRSNDAAARIDAAADNAAARATAAREKQALDEKNFALERELAAYKMGRNPANEEFANQTAKNLAELNANLGFGTLSQIQQFVATPEGRAIADEIARKGAMKLPFTLTPGQQAYLASYKAALNPAPATTTTSTGGGGATAPVVSYTPVGASTTAAMGTPITAPAAIPTPNPARPVTSSTPTGTPPRTQYTPLTQLQAEKLPKGTVFYGTDNKWHIQLRDPVQ